MVLSSVAPGFDRLAMVISGFGGADTPDRVAAELDRLDYDFPTDSSNQETLSNWNNLLGEGDPGGFSGSLDVSTKDVGFSATVPQEVKNFLGIGDLDFNVEIPTGIELGIVNLGDPDNSQQMVQDAVSLLSNPIYDDPEDQIILIGHSLGGDTALKIAEQSPVEIDLLALLDPVGFSSAIGPVLQNFPDKIGSTVLGVDFKIDLGLDGLSNSQGETPGFFTTSNLDTAIIPDSVKYFYNRWQTNDPFPVDFPLSPRRISGDDQQILRDLGVESQKAQNTTDPYFPLEDGDPLSLLAFLKPGPRPPAEVGFDLDPFSTAEVDIPSVGTVSYPTLNGNFLKTNAQLHHDFPDNPTIQNDLVAILNAIDPRTQEDRFEPNDSRAGATDLSSQSSADFDDLTIHDENDVDYYRVTPGDSGMLSASISFANQDGNLDLDFLDGSGNVLFTSDSTTQDQESVVASVVAGDEYFLRVHGADGDFNVYDMAVQNIEVVSPNSVDLQPQSDTGLYWDDDYTADTTPAVLIHADLREFADSGLLLGPVEVAAGEPGAAVVGFVSNATTGDVVQEIVAERTGGTSEFLFDFDVTNALPNADYVINSVVRVFDSNGESNDTHLSPPLFITIDRNAPDSSAPDLLTSSDSGNEHDDDVTRIAAPAFSGTAEANAMVDVFAGGQLVGEGVVGTDGNWEVTVEPLDDGPHEITTVIEDLAGNRSDPSEALTVWIDTIDPNLPYLDLTSDSGRHDADNVTNVNRPEVTVTASDTEDGNGNAFPHDIKFRIYNRPGDDTSDGEVLIVDTWAATGDFSENGFFTRVLTQDLNDPTGTPLADGVHNLKLVVEDRAGNLIQATLAVTVDTGAPGKWFGNPGVDDDGLHPASDTGVADQPSLTVDRITSETTPAFWGTAEADAIVRAMLVVDDAGTPADPADDTSVPIGQTVAIPSDGNQTYPNGEWTLTSTVDMNDIDRLTGLDQDGLRTIRIVAEDPAGNVSEPMDLDIFIDTQGPQVEEVNIAGEGDYSLFDPKPMADGPTPPVTSLDIDFIDQPQRVDGDNAFVYPAVNEVLATTPGHYQLVGDANGIIPIDSVAFLDETAAGDLGRTTVRLHFAEPLPDDRFTLTISDALSDDAGNKLDGESNAAEPQESPAFPTGDGVPGGDFVARFTVDSRPEIGVTAATRIYVDINGNFVYDPSNPDDATNRDLVFQAGLVSDAYFSGDFNAAGDSPSSGFDKIGVFGWDPFAQEYRFLLDLNDNGVPDVNTPANVPGSALPVAGDFVPDHPGDEIGLFTGDTWVLDNDGDNIVNINDDTVIHTDMRGIPIVGDVNGDGSDDLITYDAGDDTFSIDLNRDGVVNDTIAFGIPDFVERPVVGDVNLDGIDDLGLWVAGSGDKIGEGKAEWYFLVSDRVPEAAGVIEPSLLFDEYSPEPLGNDLFANFGDRHSLPIFGNFDPPVADTPAGHQAHYTNKENAYDVNGDSFVTPVDVLLVIRHLNTEGSDALPEMMVEYDDSGPFLDVTEDGFVSPVDALTVIRYLNGENQASGDVDAEGESLTAAVDASEDSSVVVPTSEPGGAGGVAADIASANDTDRATRGSGDATVTTATDPAALLNVQPKLPVTESERDSLFHNTATEALETDQGLEDTLALIADDVEDQWWNL